MRKQIYEFVRIVAETLPPLDPVYEFGSLQVAGQEGFADLRPLFPGRPYVGADMRPGPGVDCLLDLHHLALADGTVGTALVVETLEHVEFCHQAVTEVHRVLQPGGILVISSTMNLPIHGCPNDYWRFTPEGFRSLLRPFAWSFVDTAGEPDLPHTVVGVGCKGGRETTAPERFPERMAAWHRHWNGLWQTDPFGMAWRLFVPPVLRILYRRWRPHAW